MRREVDDAEMAPTLVPAPLVDVIRKGFDVFLALQGTRYRRPDDSTPPMPAVMMTKTATASPGGDTLSLNLRHAEWSELYRHCIAPLGEEDVNGLWGLVSTVLQILADGGAHTVSTGGAICAWYRAFYINEEYLEEKLEELATKRLGSASDADVEAYGLFFLDVIERCFFAGAFDMAATVMETLMAALRAGSSFNPFSHDVETCIANVKRLLVTPYTDATSFEEWRCDANNMIFDAKRTLEEGCAAARSTNGFVRVAAALCTMALNMLLAISGDMLLIQQRCQEAHFGLLEYLTALCAVSIPFKTLSELREVLATAAEAWANDAEQQWMYDITLKLFAAETLGDVVAAMGTAGEVAEANFSWDPEDILATLEDERGDEDDELLALEEEDRVKERHPSVRRFALIFMAAHIADVCAPAVSAASHEVALTFTRNDLVAMYTRSFGYHDMLWKVAATYVAYSPLINPALLANVLLFAARGAVTTERTDYLRFCSFYHTMLEAGSAHQRQLRHLLHQRLGHHPTLIRWLEVFDDCCREAYTGAHRYIIAARFNQGDVAMAAWLAMETQLPSPLQFELKRLLRGPTALQDESVYKIGEAVHNSFLALDVSPTAELALSLYVCAAISEYRRASAAFTTLHQDPAASVPAVLRSGAWCLQCVEKTLTRIDACLFVFHPVTLFTLVEHGADMLLCMRDILQKVGVAAYANLAGPVLPVLQQAFVLCRIHCGGPRGIPPELHSREDVIAEKLSRTLETHTS